MRKYKHWLKLDRIKTTREYDVKAWNNLKEYLKQYPDAKLQVYNAKYRMFDKYFCLECNQNYHDLDLDVNSCFDGSLIKLSQKPKDIELINKDFEEIFEMFTKPISA